MPAWAKSQIGRWCRPLLGTVQVSLPAAGVIQRGWVALGLEHIPTSQNFPLFLPWACISVPPCVLVWMAEVFWGVRGATWPFQVLVLLLVALTDRPLSAGSFPPSFPDQFATMYACLPLTTCNSQRIRRGPQTVWRE